MACAKYLLVFSFFLEKPEFSSFIETQEFTASEGEGIIEDLKLLDVFFKIS